MADEKGTPVCLVTGASSGIGRAIAARMAGAGFRVIVSGRDPERLAATARDVASTGADVDTVMADLSEQAGVRDLAKQVLDRHDRLDVLINNAGMTRTTRRVTEDGFELTWAVNYLAPVLLTHLLLDRASRVVNVTSAAQGFGRLDFDDLQFERRRYAGMAAYAQAKLALLMFTVELGQRLKGTGTTVNCVHPGGARTNLGRDLGPSAKLMAPLMWLLSTSPGRAAEAPVHLATAPELAGVTGSYFRNGRPPRPGRPNRLAADTDARRRLWQLSLHMTGLDETKRLQ
jgi:NAD(P)-dependent dehydrogenase (short-subunit alcohol dehydrogenase family)